MYYKMCTKNVLKNRRSFITVHIQSSDECYKSYSGKFGVGYLFAVNTLYTELLIFHSYETYCKESRSNDAVHCSIFAQN